MPAAMTPDPDEAKLEEPMMEMPTDDSMPEVEEAATGVMAAMDEVKDTMEEKVK
jgi:hypothetical protein